MKKILIGLSILILAGVVFWGCSSSNSKRKQSYNSTNNNTSQNNQSNRPNTFDGFGYDDDTNGVWDDLDKHIKNRYPNDMPKQAALRQMSKALQASVKAGEAKDDTAAQKARAALSKANYCLSERFDDMLVFDKESSLLEIEMLKGGNDRREAYQKFNAMLSGGFYGSDQKENPCE